MAKYSMEETVERTKDKIPTVYHLDLDQMTKLYEMSRRGDALDALIMAFEFGFAKGTRAHKNKSVPALY